MNITYCCFEVSSQCNMGCEFCFSDWRKAKVQVSTLKAKHIIGVLKQNGLKAINLTGGECLLRDDIVELCGYAKHLGLIVIISTNGIELKNKMEILDYIDAINLPLDSHDSVTHNIMRPCICENHHALILDLIDYIRFQKPNIKIKVNTLVSAFNKDEIVKIGELLNGKVFRWKLGKFLSIGYGEKYKEKFDISKADFENLVSKVSQKYPDSGFFDEDFEEEYIFIDNQGQINQVTASGSVKHGEIDNLSSLPEINSKEIYFNKIYNKKGA